MQRGAVYSSAMSGRTDAARAITVTVTFFADLRRFLPRGADGPQRYTLSGNATIADLLAVIGIKPDADVTAAVNGDLARGDPVGPPDGVIASRDDGVDGGVTDARGGHSLTDHGVGALAAGGGGGLSFMTPPLEQDTEITGPLAAQLWVSSTTEDMDLFLTLRNIDRDGNDVLEIGQQGQPVPVAKGWLRVSHRELDPELSRPYRPYHKHLRRQWLKPNEIVEVQVEVWPTSMVFRQGHRIQLDVQPRDGVGSQSYMHYHADYNTGTNTIYAGGARESYLLLPVIPAKG